MFLCDIRNGFLPISVVIFAKFNAMFWSEKVLKYRRNMERAAVQRIVVQTPDYCKVDNSNGKNMKKGLFSSKVELELT